MSEHQVIAAIGRAVRNAELIRGHSQREYFSVICLVRLADVERMAGSLGPETAKLAVEEFAASLAGLVRKHDELHQVAPRKWALLIKGVTSRDHLALLLSRVARQLEHPVTVLEQPILLKVNLGYAVADAGGAGPAQLFWQAERHLEAAREQGVLVAREDADAMDCKPLDWALEQDLRRALDDGEFTVYFQPKVAARFGAVAGAEALVRWQSRARGVVAPGQFIELVESSDLVLPFTYFVLKHAVALASRWPGALSVAVNLPPPVLADAGLAELIADVLDIYQIEPRRLVLEVTEGRVVSDIDMAVQRLQALRGLGVGISLDDFGTGHSSLAHLSRLPLDELKIDQSFVRAVEQQPEMVRYIVDLAHSLKLRVVAEGAETRTIMAILSDLGVDYLQGYGIARPMPQHEFLPWLAQNGVA